MAEQSRKGDNLYTCSIVAIIPIPAKWPGTTRATPHDTHDWDATEAPVLIDGVIDGKPRKLLAQANRDGYFFLLDRTTGEHILTTPLIDSLNWTSGLNKNGQPIPNPAKYPKPDGALVSPAAGGATNWPAPASIPKTGLFYVGVSTTWSMFYQTDTDDHPKVTAASIVSSGTEGGSLLAIDYKTGKAVWKHSWPGGGGPSHILTTAGKLLFTGNGNNIIAFDPATVRSSGTPVSLALHPRTHHLHARWPTASVSGSGRQPLLIRSKPTSQMTRTCHAFFLLLSLSPLTVSAQGVDKNMPPAPASDSWPSFFGDYSGRRFSPLKEITNANVQISRSNGPRASLRPRRHRGQHQVPALLVNGILYFTSPNNGWAADARTGRELWHYGYPANTGNTNGNRGFGYYGNCST